MSTRVGYRALIIDSEVWAFRLSQFLTRPEYNNKIIQSVSFLDALNDAHYHAEQHDFIYIDPFAFSLADAVRFIVEVLQRSPVKAFTFYRSGRQWQERSRDLEGLALTPARLRTMLFLDKDLMGDASFGQMVRNNIMSMERDFLAELQRSGLSMDPLTRSGVWTTGDFGAPRAAPTPAYEFPPAQPYSAASMPLAYGTGLPPQQVRELAETVASLLGRQTATPTHPVTPLLPAPDYSQLSQQVTTLKDQVTAVREQLGQVQQGLGPLQQTVTALQQHEQAATQAQTKQQEALTGAQRDQRDVGRQVTGLEQRLRDAESRQTKGEQQINDLRVTLNTWRFLTIAIAAVLGLGIIAIVVALILGAR